MKLATTSIAVSVLSIFITVPFVLSNAEDTCRGPREDLRTEVAGYIPPGRQVILADTVHEFTDCGQISQWSMIFSCTASSDGNGYPLELQVFRQNGNSFRLLSKAQVTLTDEQCERQLVSFYVSLPFCQRDHVGMYVPNTAGLTGLGYRETENPLDTYVDKELSVPPSVDDRISSRIIDIRFWALPLVSVKVTNCDMDSTEPPPTTTSSSEPVPFSSTTAPSTSAQPNPSTTRVSEKSSTTSTTQGPHVLAATPAPVLHPTALPQATTATFITKSASVMSLPTTSPSLGLDTQFDATIMNSNETVAAVVAAILFLATVTVVALTGVFVAVFVCCRQRRARSESRCTGSSVTHLAASEVSGIEAEYSEVVLRKVDYSRPNPTPYELPVTDKKASAYEFEDGKDDLVLLEEQQFIRTATGLTISSRTAINSPRLDQLFDDSCYTRWVVPSMNQRREMETEDQSTRNTYWELEPYYDHCSVLDGVAADTKICPVTNESHYEVDSPASYCMPGLKEEEIYSQMSQWKYREIPHNLITLSNQLGVGQFGEVYQAEWEIPQQGVVDVAVKLVKNGAPREERLKLLQEAAILGQFRHKHVVSLLGVVTLREPKMLVMELLHGGNLRKHLESIRRNEIWRNSAKLPCMLLKFCRQVAEGLSYLAGKSFVHRDIAARNILLDTEHNCKISDFGMSRDLDEDTYYVTSGGCIPIKWTSPEAILYQKYSTSSDVWSYGMLMYEIWSLGHQPFEDKTVDEVVKMFGQSGHPCQAPPPGCPRVMYAIMVDCWNPDRGARPSASTIVQELSGSQLKLLAISFAQELSEPQLKLALSKDTPSALPACTLGAPLEEGRALYQDLQTKYS